MITNYERIKQMSVEEMAEFLSEASEAGQRQPNLIFNEWAITMIKQWLESEAE